MGAVLENTKHPHIKRDSSSGTYHAIFMLNAKRFRKSLKTKSFEVAKRMLADLQAKVLTGKPLSVEQTELFKDAWIKFIEDKQHGRYMKSARIPRESTMKNLTYYYTNFYEPHFGHKQLSKISDDDWLNLLKENDHLKLNNISANLISFFKWALRTNRITKAPHIYLPKKTNTSDNDIERVGTVIPKATVTKMIARGELEHNLWISMGYYMGMRSSEITQLPVKPIDLKNGMIKLPAWLTKTNKYREVPVHKLVMPLLTEQLKLNTEYLFPNLADTTKPMDRGGFKKKWMSIKQSLNINCRFHDLRHTHATIAFKAKGSNPLVICSYLGMDIKVAQDIYLHVNHLDRAKQLESA